MASSSSSEILVIAGSLVLLLILGPVVSVDPATQQRIDEICRQMEEYGFCIQIFAQNLYAPTDYVGLTKVANEQALRNATNTLHLIRLLLANTRAAPALRNALQTCENGYTLVEQAFQQGLSYFNQRDYDSMMKAERIAPRAQGSCDVVFNTPPIPPNQNPLLQRNRQMRILIAMSLVSGHHLQP